jgi:hypothetical protein
MMTCSIHPFAMNVSMHFSAATVEMNRFRAMSVRPEIATADEWMNAGTRPSPLDTYVHAKSWFDGFFTVFSVSSWTYAAFLNFFAGALAFSLAIEFRRHYPNAVMKAAELIALLLVLWKL